MGPERKEITKLEDLSSPLLCITAEARSSWSAEQGNGLSAPQLLPTGYKVVTQGTSGLLPAQATLDSATL